MMRTLLRTEIRPHAALVLPLLVLWYAPWLPAVPFAHLDSGWALVLSLACERHYVFGSQLLFTWGPLGCLGTWQYWPSTYWPALALWAAVAVCAGVLILEIATTDRARWWAAAALVWQGATWDSALLALPVAVVLNAWARPRASPAAWVATLLLPAIALVKFSVTPICALAVAAAVALRSDDTRVQRFAQLACALAALLLWWAVAARQPLPELPHWLASAAEVARGYPQAMAWPPAPSMVPIEIGVTPYAMAAVALTVLVVLAIGATAQTRSRAARVVFVTFFVLLLFAAVRQGSVRADKEHLVHVTATVGALTLLLQLWVAAPSRVLWLCTAATAVAAFYVRHPVTSRIEEGLSKAATMLHEGIAAWRSPRALLDEELRVHVSRLVPLPPVMASDGGTYDILGHGQFRLAALPIERWNPRPVFQSYSAYTPRLAAANAKHIASPAGPAWLFADTATIDGRWLTEDDASLWPLLRSHYRYVETSGRHLVLRRRDVPRELYAGESTTAQAQGADWFDVPAWPGRPVFVAIDVERAATERLKAAVWKGGALLFEVDLGPERQLRLTRLIPEVAAAGFLLTPEIRTPDQLRSWIDDAAIGPGPRRFRVVDNEGRVLHARVRFSSTPFAPPR